MPLIYGQISIIDDEIVTSNVKAEFEPQKGTYDLQTILCFQEAFHWAAVAMFLVSFALLYQEEE